MRAHLLAPPILVLILTCFFKAWATPPASELFGDNLGSGIADAIRASAEYRISVAIANREFANARHAFFEQVDKGLRGTKEEKYFAKLLGQKDFFYLQFCYVKGVDDCMKLLKGLSTVSGAGGELLDGGIDPEGLFGDWVEAIRDKLGVVKSGIAKGIAFPSSVDAIADAILNTTDQYSQYKTQRDRSEFERWSRAHRTVARPARTPLDFADLYIKYVLAPAISIGVSRLPENVRIDATKKMHDWLRQVRSAIADFESEPFTLDNVADCMRQRNYNDSFIRRFRSAYIAPNIGARTQQLEIAVIDALNSASVAEEGERLGRMHNFKQSIYPFRACIYKRGLGKLTKMEADLLMKKRFDAGRLHRLEYLFEIAQPYKMPRPPYYMVRSNIVENRLITDPKFYGIDQSASVAIDERIDP